MLQPGVRLGPYEVLALVDAGGMGEVYRARDTRLRRDVAVKVLAGYDPASPDRLQRFDREARAAAALNHPNILAVYDVGNEQGTPFIVSELLEGETLRGANDVVRKVSVDGGSPLVVRSEPARNVVGIHDSTLYSLVERALVDGSPEFEIRAADPEDGPRIGGST